ncbi:MAG: hypothetical protein QOJ42_2411 [Acidobacteriaceae bacterium]|nr:hypothetical protein [Acidobacteriaceae bacterium]
MHAAGDKCLKATRPPGRILSPRDTIIRRLLTGAPIAGAKHRWQRPPGDGKADHGLPGQGSFGSFGNFGICNSRRPVSASTSANTIRFPSGSLTASMFPCFST